MLTQERLKELLHYDPETGVFTWKVDKARAKAGDTCGSLHKLGYLTTRVDGHSWRIHRLVWFYHYGSMPLHEIDHIDGDKTNNRIENLREATRAQNCQNKTFPTRTGFKGVGMHNGRFRARIAANNRHIFLGRFMTAEEAYAAYCKAARELHGEFARVA